ncbi:MAG: folate family ECF transporter S component [Clostridia bacterium]|nr:folate family ECF transporter S component [Clostridia bacterium]
MKNKLNIRESFKSSARELSSPLSLAVCAMLLAISLVLSYFGNVSITFMGTNVIKLSFAVIPIAAAAMLYGPVPAAIIGALSDIIGFVMMPMGAYIPGFTISMILTGIIYGIAFYKRRVNAANIALSTLAVAVVINVLLGTVWFVLFYGFQLKHALFVRGIKELVMYPITVGLLFSVNLLFSRLPDVHTLRSAKTKS